MAEYRTEHDSMGDVRVPARAYYGAQTQRAVENFPISGRPLPPPLIHALGRVKLACARANRDLGKLTKTGKQPLDDFFAKHALANDRRGLGKTFVLRAESGEPSILGFYTLSMADIEVANLPDKVKRGLPQYPVPVARIARLATDERVRGKGHGADLLDDAFHRIVSTATTIGCFGVLVDAMDDDAVAFYARYGFVDLGAERWPRPMFLSMKVLRRALTVA